LTEKGLKGVAVAEGEIGPLGVKDLLTLYKLPEELWKKGSRGGRRCVAEVGVSENASTPKALDRGGESGPLLYPLRLV